jgi:orotate phosphoribosyltransferase
MPAPDPEFQTAKTTGSEVVKRKMTSEQVLDIYQKTGALLSGHFLLSSGLHSEQYLQSALVLQQPEIATKLCAALAENFKDSTIEVVIAPALGGVFVSHETARALGVRAIFAERVSGEMMLRRGFMIKPGERVLVVEDVITTGKSTKETIDVVQKAGGVVVAAAALIDRSGGKADIGVPYKSLVTLAVPAYTPEMCPLCKAGSKPTKPGSRGLA